MDAVRIKISSSDEEFSSLKDLIDSGLLGTGDTITFLTDVTIADPVTFTKKCTIDLGGHFLFVAVPSAITVKNAAIVDIINGKIQTLASGQVEDTLIVQGSKTVVTLGEGLEIDTRGTAVHVRKRGGLVIDDASVRSTGSQPTIYVEDTNSTLAINAGKVASYEKSAIVLRTESVAAVHGGEVYTESNGLVPDTTYPAILVNGKDTKLQVNGGSIFSAKTPAVRVEASGELLIAGGTVYTTSDDYHAVEVMETFTSFMMTDGWVYSTKTSAVMSNKLEYGDRQTIQMTGGKMGAKGNVFHVAGSGDSGILVSGGKVKGELPQAFIAAGYVVSDIKDDDGYASIILKTWTSDTDVSPKFPTDAGSDPDVHDNPFDPVADPEVTETLPFPPAPIAGDYNDLDDPANVVFNTLDYPPYPAINDVPGDVFEPSVPVTPVIPVPVPPEFEPIPEPGPAPGPVPPPKPDEIAPILYNSSVNIRHRITIYKTPSRKHPISEWRGALTILSGGYFNHPTGEEFAMVKFRVPGSGSVSTGYAPVFDLAHP